MVLLSKWGIIVVCCAHLFLLNVYSYACNYIICALKITCLALAGYRKVAHTGLTGSFHSLLTLYPDVKLGIFGSVNGPLFPLASYFLQAVHMYAMDVVMEEEPWLNVTSVGNVTSGTACTYPFPWADLHIPYDDGNSQEDGSKEPKQYKGSPESNVEGTEGDFEPFIGIYRHLLLVDFNVYFNSSAGEMWATAGRIGIGRLIATEDEDIFTVELHGSLAFITELGPPLPPVVFSDLQDGVYHDIIAYVIDGSQPPTYVRDLDWDDLPPPPSNGNCAGTAHKLTAGEILHVIIPMFISVLTIT